ncbi:MAG: ATP-binding protein [Xenococcaceae cyanobacterium]
MSSQNYPTITSSRVLRLQAASVLLYQSVFNNEVGNAFLNLLQTLHQRDSNLQTRQMASVFCLQAYGNWFKTLAARNQSWQDYLITQILRDENPFSQKVQRVSVQDLPPSLIAAAKHDLQALQSLYNCSSQQISQWLQTASQLPVTPVAWDLETATTTFLHHQDNWADALEELAAYYRQHGTGIFAEYRALRWQQGQLVGIAHPDPVQLTEIVGYEYQKDALLKNTEFLLAGYPALHVLLYGSRGSGKSSLVKGLLQKYSKRGLRLIEVGKSELKDLPTIVEQLRDVPQKFIIFVDDLSFEEDGDDFKALKVVLEGSLTARAQNVVVYATSNRRHLIREFFGDRPRPSDGDEVHAWDTVQEKLSFSDRFGLTLTFEPANQDTYLNIVRHLAKQARIPLTQEDLEFRAKQWATRHNGRSGRTARQFIDFLGGELALSKSRGSS